MLFEYLATRLLKEEYFLQGRHKEFALIKLKKQF